jgi:FKBP-type peptidyl-prolyl cis-trans isomerase
MMRLCFLLVLLLPCAVTSWSSAPTAPSGKVARQQQQRQSPQTRKAFFQSVATTTAAAATAAVVGTAAAPRAAAAVETLPNGVSYEVIKRGDGPKPDVGELVAVRFAAYAPGDVKIDDIFETPEPYYTRLGSGGLIRGVEETLPLMRLGDRWKLTIPVRLFGLTCGWQKRRGGMSLSFASVQKQLIRSLILTSSFSSATLTQGNLAFGKQGRKASAGKPRIPADATIIFDVEMVGLPGKEPELIELIGDF